MSLLRRSERVTFAGGNGFELAGIIDLPVEPPRAWAIFTHCFTCTKDIKLIVRISRLLAEQGFGVLRYDLTGLGQSHGDFSQTNFTTNRHDLSAAIAYLNQHNNGPTFLIGHSFGGAVSLSLAAELPSILGVVALAAPSETQHLASVLTRLNGAIEQVGSGSIIIGGIEHRIERQMLENFRQIELHRYLSELSKPVLLVHSQDDETLDYSHAVRLHRWLTERPESSTLPACNSTLVCLSGADHLLTGNTADLTFVARLIANWFDRTLALRDGDSSAENKRPEGQG